MAGHFVKLYGSILNSSVWCSTPEVKLVWITMLLLGDGDGNVYGAVPGIARQAGVPVEACREAIKYLSGPDPDSRTPDHEGRRILPIDGGWKIVNSRKYREMRTERQRQSADRAQRYRERKAAGQTRRPRDASRKSRAEVEVETDTTDIPPEGAATAAPAAKKPRAPSVQAEAVQDYEQRFGAGSAPGGRIAGVMTRLVEHQAAARSEEPYPCWSGWVRPAWRRYLAETTHPAPNVNDFAQHFADWAGVTALARAPARGGGGAEARSDAAVARFIQRGR
ncbi:hypothetical protein [Longimicrobium sp.]|uniref:hypothetical protein n=1 Tax=Longimicrobium sp. TaxID=2029185 RepID=UPI002E35BED8|nr:hypothetical protein [Longimicrobium sp.]HEX6038882.1 hypothetical protein [Longimicrobium sp.]